MGLLSTASPVYLGFENVKYSLSSLRPLHSPHTKYKQRDTVLSLVYLLLSNLYLFAVKHTFKKEKTKIERQKETVFQMLSFKGRNVSA